jgi:uncharacterized C2H2 Zn-finger protein
MRHISVGWCCLDCTATFKYRQDAARHVQRKHLTGAPTLVCRFCQKTYKVDKDRQQHMKLSHGMALSLQDIRELDY